MTQFEIKSVVLDTNILMSIRKSEEFFDMLASNYDKIYISIETIIELDRLKTKEGQRGFEARGAVRFIKKYAEYITIAAADVDLSEYAKVSFADSAITNLALDKNATLLTNDVAMETIAAAIGTKAENYYEPADEYGNGYVVFDLWQPERSDFALTEQQAFKIITEEYNIPIGQYLVITSFGLIQKIYIKVLGGSGWEQVDYKKQRIQSTALGCYKPMPGDIAQILAFDMLGRNDISLLTGPAGSGKTMLALAKQFEMISTGEIRKITIFVNPEKARGAKTLGFYKGDRNLKLMQESVGGILASKLESMAAVINALDDDVIEVIPISDIRGYEVRPYSSLYITEAQNLTVDLMQLAVQRAGDGVKVFIEGDPTTQLDSWMYEGDNNGMLKLIKTFTGTGVFGHINLDKIYRSKVAEIADKMTK